MYNVLIVEDSKPILRNITTLLCSLDLPVTVVATATNGEDALEIIRQQPVHLLLTDIRMPKMDGLALIEQAKLIHPQLKVVLISGYSDFEYTRKALNLQVFDYLLKPVERQQLSEVMNRAIEQLSRHAHNEVEMLKDIIEPVYYGKMELNEQFQHYAKLMFIVRKQPFTAGRAGWNREALQHRLSELFAPHACWVFPTYFPKQFLVLVNGTVTGKYSTVYECMESARRHLYSHGIDATIGGQLQPAEPGKLPELYYRLTEMINEHQRINQGTVLDSGVPLSQIRSESENGDPFLAANFVEMIRGRRKEQFELKLTEQLAKWSGENLRLAELERFIGLLIDTFAHLITEQDSDNRLSLEESSAQLFDRESFAGFGRDLLDWSGLCFEMLQAHQRKNAQEWFQQVDEYVKMNMYSPLSITDVARKFHISPSYISRIIKKCTQSTFVQYYTKLKINEACKLMEGRPDMKFKEISDALSFSDQHYFSKVFKEYMGYNPTEYREQVLAGQDGEEKGIRG
ncbi:two-component system response regulator YesN [Fontibacillus phaseoli]|uniref:Two-component system response regulator YesN n=1 Tax=Fontibacillus phaseoli TaxID=1416533 RepID=A0A369BJ23_9BACL|nr:response regulator [Fontibacillus phaseoli]RCX20576.1 two-component system response regulator YesN [Fontibacillus phaseoli]